MIFDLSISNPLIFRSQALSQFPFADIRQRFVSLSLTRDLCHSLYERSFAFRSFAFAHLLSLACFAHSLFAFFASNRPRIRFVLHSPFLPRKEVIQPHLPIRLPCYDFTPVIGLTFDGCSLAVRSPASGAPNSHGVTGGVYKARERIHRGMLIRDY